MAVTWTTFGDAPLGRAYSNQAFLPMLTTGYRQDLPPILDYLAVANNSIKSIDSRMPGPSRNNNLSVDGTYSCFSSYGQPCNFESQNQTVPAANIQKHLLSTEAPNSVVACAATAIANGSRDGIQESDRLDAIPSKVAKEDAGKDAIRLVSLGCACGPKLAFKELGRGAETLPFDWICTTVDGVLDFISTGFEGFYDFTTKVEKDVGGKSMSVFRDHHHSFWHDDPTELSMRDRYQRRIGRFLNIDAQNQVVLFVRLAATSDEVGSVDKLSNKLTAKFGSNAMLLLMLDLQGPGAVGPCIVEGLPGVLIHFLEGGNGIDKFCNPIDNALSWAARRSTRCVRVPTLKAACDIAKPAQTGNYGMGGIPAFEGIPDLFGK